MGLCPKSLLGTFGDSKVPPRQCHPGGSRAIYTFAKDSAPPIGNCDLDPKNLLLLFLCKSHANTRYER